MARNANNNDYKSPYNLLLLLCFVETVVVPSVYIYSMPFDRALIVVVAIVKL